MSFVCTFYHVLDTDLIFFRLMRSRLEKLIGVAAIELILKVVLEALVVDTSPFNLILDFLLLIAERLVGCDPGDHILLFLGGEIVQSYAV